MGAGRSVGDADNFRLYHTPGIFWRWPLKFWRVPSTRKGAYVRRSLGRLSHLLRAHAHNVSAIELQGQTIHVRIGGIDAPEAAHFGRPGQPGAAEALAWLKSKIEGRTLWCELIRRDQYSRIVCHEDLRRRMVLTSMLQVGHPFFPPRFLPGKLFTGRPLALDMLRAGHATVYEQAHAEYGKWGKDALLKVEAEAK
jgi:endonuclease YncB( thermonuclease family)